MYETRSNIFSILHFCRKKETTKYTHTHCQDRNLVFFRFFLFILGGIPFSVNNGGCYVNVRSLGKNGKDKTSKNAPNPFNPLALFGFVLFEPEGGFIS